jgi:predicted outer membrane repeat protein
MAIITVTSLADNGPGSLREAIANALPGDSIAFDSSLANQTITLTSGQIDIPAGKNLTIDGDAATGLTISGNNTSRIFGINANVDTATNVTLKNLTLNKAYTSERGGAINTSDEVTLNVENVQFNNNVADKGGGAIFMGWNSDISVTASSFDGNKAVAGNDERGAGAIAFVSPGQFTIKDSTFSNNQGINGGAINSLNGKLSIENTRFINNDTTGAVYDTGKENPFLRGYGGAIYTDRASSVNEASGTIRITNSVFEGNKGRGEGGAAYLYTGTQDNVVIENSTFTGNQVMALPNGGNAGNGGALVQISNGLNQGFTVTNTTFANNTAAKGGGGVWIYDAPTTITNSTFSGNRAEATDFNGNGGAIALYAPANIVNSTIANNYAGWVAGGVLAADGRDVNVKNTIFSNNTAANGPNNWGIQQHTNRELTDQGGNLQWPPKQTTNYNDYNATASITLADPKLGELQNVDGAFVMPLQQGSPAIDTGIATGAPTTDGRGLARPQDGDGNGSAIVDSGAYEYGTAEITPPPPPPQAPEIQVLDATTEIVDGNTTALNFGSTTVGTPVVKAFTIKNTGTGELNLSNLQLPTGFSVVGEVPATVAVGGETQLQIKLDAAASATPTGEISFATNDSDENPFNFSVSGTVTNPAPQPINGTFRSESLSGTVSDDTINGYGGDDTITGAGGNDQLFGWAGNDVISGQQGNDQLFGGYGQDKLYGGEGADTLWGDFGDDQLYGQAGNDVLNGGPGIDLLVGGALSDTFMLTPKQGTDTFSDFSLGEDKIGLTGGLSLPNLSIQQMGSSTLITNNNGNEVLATLPGIDAAQLIAQAPSIFV